MVPSNTETAVDRSAPVDGKREHMLERALEVFVAHGYVGTSTDQLAAAAAVSKQTLYKSFGDKEGIFAALIDSACDRVEDPFDPLVDRMQHVESAAEGVRLIAEQFTRSIMNTSVQQLRRLVIAEAARFPHLSQAYWERGFQRAIDSVGRCLATLDERRLLAAPDPRTAAEHFAGLLLWIPGNRAMFATAAAPLSAEEMSPITEAGSAAFIRAYRPDVA